MRFRSLSQFAGAPTHKGTAAYSRNHPFRKPDPLCDRLQQRLNLSIPHKSSALYHFQHATGPLCEIAAW
jgi:hypothetical protein